MNNEEIMLKTYTDERINKELKKCLVRAVADDEFDMRYDLQYGMTDFKILLDNIDKMLFYVNNGYRGELRLNSNIWYVCLDTLENILALYDLKLVGDKKVTEEELVIPINKVGKIKAEVFKKMKEYGWQLEDFDRVYKIHYDFIDRTYDYISEEDYDFSMQDISKAQFEEMIDFMSDFLRALDEIDKDNLEKKLQFLDTCVDFSILKQQLKTHTLWEIDKIITDFVLYQNEYDNGEKDIIDEYISKFGNDFIINWYEGLMETNDFITEMKNRYE